jgi:hypothetical protein
VVPVWPPVKIGAGIDSPLGIDMSRHGHGLLSVGLDGAAAVEVQV